MWGLLFRGLKWIAGEVISSAIVSAVMPSSPQYEIVRDYPAPEQYKTEDQKARYYESKFTSVSEPITEKELKGHFFGDVDGVFKDLYIKEAITENDTVFFSYHLTDEKLNSFAQNGYLINEKDNEGKTIKSSINLRYKTFTDIGVYKAECTLNNKKYLLIGSSQKKIYLLSDETK